MKKIDKPETGRVAVLEAEIKRLNEALTWEEHRTGRMGTHADGCHKWGPGHYECALRKLKDATTKHHGAILEHLIEDLETGKFYLEDFDEGLIRDLKAAVTKATEGKP